MLVSFSTHSSRKKRKGGGLLVLPVTVIEQAAAAVRAAEHTGHSLILLVDATQPLLYGLDVFVQTLLALGRSSAVAISVGVQCGPTHVAAEQALTAGAQFIVPQYQGSEAQYVSLLSWSANRAAAQTAEVVVAPGVAHSLESLFSLLQTVRLAGVILPEEMLQVGGAFNPALIHEIASMVKLPLLVALHEDKMPSQMVKCIKAGVSGFLIENEFDQTFTAGIRTGLRNKTLSDPRTYLAKASLAVEEKMARYLELLCSI